MLAVHKTFLGTVKEDLGLDVPLVRHWELAQHQQNVVKVVCREFLVLN